MTRFTLAAALALAPTLALAAAHTGTPVQTGKLGEDIYLMDASKMTLYTFDKDAKGVSNCYDACAVKWPPLLAEPAMNLPKGYALATRKDDTMQVTYKGQPLYLWINDAKPGDMTGDGVKGVWHVARP